MFQVIDGILYIDHKRVHHAYESYNGWFWFITEVNERNPARSWGYTQTYEDRWGYINEYSLIDLMPYRVWKVGDRNLPYAGRR